MLRTIANNLLVKIGNIWLDKGPSEIMNVTAAYAHGAAANPADLVNIVGEVVSIPKTITVKMMGYEGFSVDNIKKGDTVIFRYDVIYAFQKDGKGWKNMFYYKGREYWAANIQKIFAVIRDGKIIMINGYIMVEDVKEKSKIILPEHIRDVENVSWGTLTQIGENLRGMEKIKANIGDTVYFDAKIIQRYEINGQPFGILRQRDVIAVDIAQYNALQLVK